jgi:hypothetical protein
MSDFLVRLGGPERTPWIVFSSTGFNSSPNRIDPGGFKTAEEAEEWLAQYIAKCIRVEESTRYYDYNGVRVEP